MIYKAYLNQAGEGCDYTIGCAQTVIDIEASDLGEAKIKLMGKIADEFIDEFALESAQLYEINEVVDIDVDDIYSRREEFMRNEELRQQEEFERQEYERLKKKYGRK